MNWQHKGIAAAVTYALPESNHNLQNGSIRELIETVKGYACAICEPLCALAFGNQHVMIKSGFI